MSMQDWLDDPENRIAYEQFLEDCEPAQEERPRRRTVRRRETGAQSTRRETGTLPVRRRRMTGRRRRRRLKLRRVLGLALRVLIAVVIVGGLIMLARNVKLPFQIPGVGTGTETETADETGVGIVGQGQTGEAEDDDARWYGAPPIYVQLLTPNEYSRPQIPLTEVNGIVIHYTANPGSGAQNNRDYFESLAETGENSVSSHFVIGLDGEIIQCIPCDEVAYASNERNSDTISIECCHPDETGAFNEATYDSMVRLTAWLCRDQGLTSEDVIRHYDVTGKDCPRYFVQNEDAWLQFRADVQNRLEELEAGTAL